MKAAEIRAETAERAAAEAEGRWAEVNDLTDRFAAQAIRSMRKRGPRRAT